MVVDKLIGRLKKLDRSSGGIVTREGKEVRIGPWKRFDKAVTMHNIAFIDGGQGIMMSTPALAVGLVRVAVVGYQKLECVFSKVSSFYIVAETDGKDFHFGLETIEDGIGIKEKCAGIVEEFTVKLVEDRQVAPVDAVNRIRRLFELAAAGTITDSLIVLDGHLECDDNHEKELMKVKDSSLLSGLAKKSNVLTDDGVPVSVLAEDGEVFAQAEMKDFVLCFARFNKRSEYVFKYEVMHKPGLDVSKLIGTLACHSTDAVFPGYPYGLIKADQTARVSNQETEYHRNLIIRKMGDDWVKLRKKLDMPDPHRILDTIY